MKLTNENDNYTLLPSDSLVEALFGNDVINGASTYIKPPTVDLGADRDNFYGTLEGSADEIIITDFEDGTGIYFEDRVFAGSGDDVIKSKGSTVDGEVDLLRGEAGNDTIYATNKADLYGDVGNDVLIGYLGSQYLYGGDGNDTLIGGGSFDRIEGNAGNDFIRQSEKFDASKSVGADRILTGWGRDKVFIQSGEGGCAVISDFNTKFDFLLVGRNQAYTQSQFGTRNSGKAVTYHVRKYFQSGSVNDGTMIRVWNPATSQYENEAFLVNVTNFSGSNF
jgi:Ca2+-binding RTX toxin-like protein